MQHRIFSTLLSFILTASPVAAQTDKPSRIIPELSPPAAVKTSALPFVFSSETLGAAIGVAAVAHHLGQPQVSLVGLGLYSSNDSWLGYLSANHLQWRQDSRWLISTELYRGYSSQGIYHLPGNPAFPDERAGGNNSSEANRIVHQSDSEMVRVRFDYILPWGDGAAGAVSSLQRQPKAGLGWSPLEHGVTSLTLEPFYEVQSIRNYQHPSYIARSRGIDFKLEWDNRDARNKVNRGNRSRVEINYDWGDGHRPSWWSWRVNQSFFIPLEPSRVGSEQVLALNAYLADTPSWNRRWRDGQFHRPPPFIGVRLGGFERFRGYELDRFHGRSALLYSAEYRVIPRWQPLSEWPLFRYYDIPWWQWASFVELGRVGDSFNLTELHQQMRYSIGTGVRLQIEGVVVRAEAAWGRDSSQFWVMVNQPF